MSKKVVFVLAVTAIALVIASCSGPLQTDFDGALFKRSSVGPTVEYIAIAEAGLSDGFAAEIASAGGWIIEANAEAGVAIVASNSTRFAKRLSRVRSIDDVVKDAVVNWLPGDETVVYEATTEDVEPFDDSLIGYMWALDAIDAYGAWEAGYTGEGVVVAVLDSGIDVDHPDLAANISPMSTSVVADEPFVDDLDGHGTHVAGTIAAVDNTIGTIGVAPNAEILAVKVLGADGSGSFGDIITGILYANAAGADVINMSLGALIYHSGIYDEEGNKVANANEVAALVNALTKVINYVDSNGTLVVTSAGNESLDSTGDAGLMHLPSDAGRTISVSATGPVGWAYDPTTNLDVPAVYTNYGAAIDLAAPGGNVALYPEPYWWYDMQMSTYLGGWAWSAGTSMASPHVAGVAALIIEANGGEVNTAQIETILKGSADDLGKVGKDEWYGHGRINAAQAVMY